LHERERIARDIHDTLLQSIQALMLRFQLALDSLPTNEPARRELEAALDRADEVVADGRDRLLDLRRTNGLNDAEETLRDIAARQLAGSNIAVNVDSLGECRPINPLVWDEMASIVAEVLFNIAQHSQASKALVMLQYNPGELKLVICDDGIGIDPVVAREGRRGHFGIPGMRERAGRVGAGFAITAGREGGTEVTITAQAAIVYHKMEIN
jgi:signal transduction histidine kinase